MQSYQWSYHKPLFNKQATMTTIHNLFPYDLLQPHSQLFPDQLRSDPRKFLTSCFYLSCDEKSENIPDIPFL